MLLGEQFVVGGMDYGEPAMRTAEAGAQLGRPCEGCLSFGHAAHLQQCEAKSVMHRRRLQAGCQRLQCVVDGSGKIFLP